MELDFEAESRSGCQQVQSDGIFQRDNVDSLLKEISLPWDDKQVPANDKAALEDRAKGNVTFNNGENNPDPLAQQIATTSSVLRR